ncbi:MAG: hypothetical protein OIF38_11325, partial [Cellvibrionaceae bacterium]|nr:hypothetical protein [Cellvibrionaceae bacterium]
LAITTFALVFGWSLTCLGGAVALALNVMMSQRLGLNLPLEFVINVLVPATASIGFISLLERLRVRNVFIFMLGGGFIGAMVALLCSVAAALALFGLGGAVAEEQMLHNYLHLYLLMLFPEGFINGAMTSVLTIFYPDMVRRYDDNAYLDKP